MLVAWRDALRVLMVLRAPSDYHLREGILRAGPSQADQLGLGLELDVFHDTLLGLHDLDYVAWDSFNYRAGGFAVDGVRVTGRGMQAVGQWPTLDTVMTPASLGQLLDELAALRTRSRAGGDPARRWSTSAGDGRSDPSRSSD
jgi:hypothetical protein